MPTLLLSPRFSSDSKLLWAAASGKGWRVERPGTWAPFGVARVDALHGEIDWARHAAQQLGLRLLDPPHDWLTHVAPHLLGRRVQHGKLAKLDVAYPAFIKPPDHKTFPAQIYEAPPMVEGYVVVSEPVQILHEVRTWVLDGRVVTRSTYVEDGRNMTDDLSELPVMGAVRIAEAVAKTPGTPRALECPAYIESIKPPIRQVYFGPLVTLAVHLKNGWHLIPFGYGPEKTVLRIVGNPRQDGIECTITGGPTTIHTQSWRQLLGMPVVKSEP